MNLKVNHILVSYLEQILLIPLFSSETLNLYFLLLKEYQLYCRKMSPVLHKDKCSAHRFQYSYYRKCTWLFNVVHVFLDAMILFMV